MAAGRTKVSFLSCPDASIPSRVDLKHCPLGMELKEAGDQLQKTACPQQTGLNEIFPVDLVSSQKNVDQKLSFQHLAILGLAMQTFRHLGQNLG